MYCWRELQVVAKYQVRRSWNWQLMEAVVKIQQKPVRGRSKARVSNQKRSDIFTGLPAELRQKDCILWSAQRHSSSVNHRLLIQSTLPPVQVVTCVFILLRLNSSTALATCTCTAKQVSALHAGSLELYLAAGLPEF